MDTKTLIQGYPISRYTLSIGAIALLYLTVAYLTTVIIDFHTIPPICPVVGIALGLLSAYGIRFWPGVALGSWACALVLGASSAGAIAAAVSHTTGAAIGVYVLRLWGWQPKLMKLKQVLEPIFWGAILSTGIAAFLDTVLGLWLHTIHSQRGFEHLWRMWLGEGMGVLLITPILVYGITRWSVGKGVALEAPKFFSHKMETAIVVVFGLALSYLVFGLPHLEWIDDRWTQTLMNLPLEYLCFPLVVWAACRYGAMGVFLTSLSIAILALMGLSHGEGLFMAKSQTQDGAIFGLEVFMVSIEIAALILVGSLTELQLTNQVLHHHEDRISEEMTRKETAIAQLEATVEQQKQQLQDYQDALERSNQLKNCLFQAIAHDLRTTLMGMVMFHQNLLKKPGETLSVRRSLLEKLTEGGDRQLQKLNTLLEVATLDGNRMAIASQPVNLALVLEGVLEDFQAYFAANQVRLNYHREPLPPVDADPQSIKRVFEHLLSNAVKHNPPGVEIQIQFHIDLSQGVSCWVIDNGVGIAPDQLPSLFSLDPQASKGQNRSALTGISLGLYQCDRILAAHGGKLTVESCPTQGSRFGFNLPRLRLNSVNLS
ncbi:sensor histidine kinase [Roseofilum capinflatum]|uniref:histidine kinase n=1 Tax=Roseofilum capinflatum BLCC-M114 TaxID=3022440 RepID=A0ABT7BCG9_9CYAN|nr:MASE1 domain-containing protein [Roseofilum capinflatum]MDJ1176879.1 MASE1 domain-containing protein [Roseofilum capinflatum BLCC-M114]